MPKGENSLNELLYDLRRIAEHREKLSEKKIQAIYRSLVKDLDSFVADEYKKYADKDGRVYISTLDAKNERAKFLREVVTRVDSISPQIKEEISELIDKTYEASYRGMVSSLKNAKTRAEFEALTRDISVNPNVLKQAIDNNISKLTLPAVLEKHRGEIIYQIQQELNIGLMQGDRYEQMARRISERVGVSQSKAMNITRTETHRNIESGFMDCAEHLSEGLEGSGLIYAVTWRTMDDQRVRPQQRRKTKSGWKTTYSKNGADHMKMEGKTVKVGELFNLGNGVKAKAPSQSGVAAHDCNCRCFLEYNLMTPEEFSKATGQAVKAKSAIIEDDKKFPAEIVGVKRGQPMTFEEANGMKANPNFTKGGGYRINCQTCVVANEARRRGYNVEALANTAGSKLSELSRKTNLAWIDSDTGTHPEYIFDEAQNTPKRFRKYLEGVIEKDKRYTLQFSWKGRGNGGHIICADRMSDGALRLYDPQIGKSYTGEEILQYVSRFRYERTFYGTKYPTPPKILRVDDKEFFLDMVNYILKGAE